MIMQYQPVIGMEIHVELKTKSKMFCQCSAEYFGKDPNTNTCPVCLGLPGALPVPNKRALEWCIKIGKALHCTINRVSKFDRKHYFYPDLPKGYQISQYDEPVAVKGYVELNGKRFGITRVHQEEDTGKLIHSGGDTLVDFNRSGVPLVEIVTEPDFTDSDDVKKFLEELYLIIRYLDVSDADMEKGSMRMEPNISLRMIGTTSLPNYKIEVKNINSFRFVKQAIDYEIERQREILDKGEVPVQETRGFDENKVATYSQRTKEEAQDYRYFPEPDIPPMVFEKEFTDSIAVPELPSDRLARYIGKIKIKESDAKVIVGDVVMSNYFERVLAGVKDVLSAQSVANLIINKKINIDLPVDEFISKAKSLSMPKSTDMTVLHETITMVIQRNGKVAADYKNGKQNALMYLVGQVMREMKGKADAKLVIAKLKEKLQ